MRVVAVYETDSVSGRLPTELWEITADEWREQKEASILNESCLRLWRLAYLGDYSRNAIAFALS